MAAPDPTAQRDALRRDGFTAAKRVTISPEGGVTVESREASDLLAIDERLTRQMADEAGTPRPRPFTVGMTTE